MHENLLKQIIKLESFAEMLQAECRKTREAMETPTTQKYVNREKRLAMKSIAFDKRFTAKQKP